ncbi:homeobox protein knotted-1-like 6 [Euphorbia lathyris]|uniref:homeobox protein knotted-1-like 6 n=1 Tax=Euphorbia lathyris TaxID=212925 RepID=UPI003313B2AF
MEKKQVLVQEEEEEEVALQKRISSHPLYGFLVQAHIDCLKIGGIGDERENQSLKQKVPDEIGSSSSLKQSELDNFMEAYCLALRKLKEAMEESQHQTVAFINTMHLQLRDLITPFSSSSSDSAEERDNNQNGQSADFSFSQASN